MEYRQYVQRFHQGDHSETVDYNVKGYPVYIRPGILSFFPNYAAPSHWHQDVEFILVYSGHMVYNVNGQLIRLEAGQGIMINSRQFHHGYSEDQSECRFLCVLIHPLLVFPNEYFQHMYVDPVITSTQTPFVHLRPHIPWQQEILTLLDTMGRQAREGYDVLHIQQSVVALWTVLYTHFPQTSKTDSRSAGQLDCVKHMVTFIREHASSPLTLAQIAAAGNTCKSNCCGLFRKYLGMSPVDYLTECRLNRSVELLLSGDKTIAEAGYEAGFNSASYYAEVFRRHFHCSPREYLKRNAASQEAKLPDSPPS